MACSILVRLSQPGPFGPTFVSGSLTVERAIRSYHDDGSSSWIMLPSNDTPVRLTSVNLVAETQDMADEWSVDIGDTYGAAGEVTLLCEPTGANDAIVVTERLFDNSVVSRWFTVPDVASINYGELTEIDPDTLLPVAEPEAAWWAALEALEPNNQHNYAGQVKIAYTGFGLADAWVAGVSRTLDPETATTATIVASPTTVWPHDATPQTLEGVYNTTTNRWRENNVRGQTNRWRFIGTYSDKQQANTGQLTFKLTNPDSGFVVDWNITLPSGVTSGSFTVELITIADDQSLAVGRGYILSAMTSFSDASMNVDILSATRFSLAVDWPLPS